MSNSARHQDPVAAGYSERAARLSVLIEGRTEIPSHHGTTRERAERKHEPRVYYVISEFGGLIKIGRTVDFSTRFYRMHHNNSCRNPILLAWEPGDYDLESYRHHQLEASNHRGEWFYVTDELIDHIESVRESM